MMLVLIRTILFLLIFGIALCSPAFCEKRSNKSLTAKDIYLKREALWKAFLGALPEDKKPVTAYAENDTLDTILFRANRVTYVFSLSENKVKPVLHAKRLPHPINRITYEKNDNSPGGSFLLWYYGKVELSAGY